MSYTTCGVSRNGHLRGSACPVCDHSWEAHTMSDEVCSICKAVDEMRIAYVATGSRPDLMGKTEDQGGSLYTRVPFNEAKPGDVVWLDADADLP